MVDLDIDLNLHDGRWGETELFEVAFESLPGKRAFAQHTSDQGFLERLMMDGNVNSSVASNQNISAELPSFNDFVTAAISDPFALGHLVSNPALSTEFFHPLLAEPNPFIRSGVARSIPLDELTFNELAHDPDASVRRAVAENPHLTADMVAVLAQDEASGVRAAAGAHPCASADVLETLVVDDDFATRGGVARNPNLSFALLAQLLQDREPSVRNLVARNSTLPGDILAKLAMVEDHTLRPHVGANTSTPEDVLMALSQDKDWRVRQSVASNQRATPDTLDLLSTDSNFLVRQQLASRGDLNDDSLRRLAADRSWETRALVAGNPTTPPDILEALGADPYPDVREAVLSQESTPRDVFLRVLEGFREEARNEARVRESAGVETLGISDEPSIELWPTLTDDQRRVLISGDASSLEELWRTYFHSWSVNDLFATHGPFEPLELAADLELPGADELLETVHRFDFGADVEDSREHFGSLVDEFADWISAYLPIVPEGFNANWGFSIENSAENREKLRSFDSSHVWSVYWGDVECLIEGFSDTDDVFRTTGFFVTDQPHIDSGEYVCDLALRLTCLLCEGQGSSTDGEGCPACEEGGQFVVEISDAAREKATRSIAASLRGLTGWM